MCHLMVEDYSRACQREREERRKKEEEEKAQKKTSPWLGFEPTDSVSTVECAIHLATAPCPSNLLRYLAWPPRTHIRDSHIIFPVSWLLKLATKICQLLKLQIEKASNPLSSWDRAIGLQVRLILIRFESRKRPRGFLWARQEAAAENFQAWHKARSAVCLHKTF